mgnify:FL=1
MVAITSIERETQFPGDFSVTSSTKFEESDKGKSLDLISIEFIYLRLHYLRYSCVARHERGGHSFLFRVF